MNYLLLICAIFVGHVTAIHNGVDVSAREHRFMVSIQFGIRNTFVHTCGGVIINERWILTADSECYQPDTVFRTMIVVAGRRNLMATAATEQIFGVEHRRVVRLPEENLALVRLNGSLTFNDDFVNSIRLPGSMALDQAVFMGWSNRVGLRNILQRAVFPIMPNSECQRVGIAGIRFRDFHICTGPFVGGFSTCAGNRGGPLFKGSARQETLVGILVNHPNICGEPNQATGIYVNIQRYTDWITSNTRI